MKPYWMNARMGGKCWECGDTIEQDERFVFEPKERKMYCAECGSGDDMAGPDKKSK